MVTWLLCCLLSLSSFSLLMSFFQCSNFSLSSFCLPKFQCAAHPLINSVKVSDFQFCFFFHFFSFSQCCYWPTHSQWKFWTKIFQSEHKPAAVTSPPLGIWKYQKICSWANLPFWKIARVWGRGISYDAVYNDLHILWEKQIYETSRLFTEKESISGYFTAPKISSPYFLKYIPYYKLREASPFQNGWIFGKVPKGEGGEWSAP